MDHHFVGHDQKRFMSMSLARLILCTFFSLSIAEVDLQLLDDECAVEGEKCSLQALQMKGRKLAASAEACTGSGILPSGADLCYQGQLLVETFKVKVLNSKGQSGAMDMQAVGPIAGKCDGVDFEISGQQVTAKDLSTCGIQGAEYDVKYCSDQDQFVVQIIKPMALDVTLARGSCASFVQMPSPHHGVALLAQEMQGEVSAALQDCGEGPLPSGIVCYEGQLLVETFKVKVTNSDGTTGSLDMQAIGPLAGQCDGVEFEKEGSQLTANNLNNCGISGAEYDVKYCSNTDQFVVQITKPMTLDVILARSSCDSSLAAVAPPQLAHPAAPHPAALVAQEAQRYCSGYRGLPKGTLCYSGKFLVESFFVKVKTYSSSSGKVDVKASGPKNGACYGLSFRKSGQYINLNYAKCGFSGLKFSVLYCSNQDAVKVHVTAPVIGDVMLTRTSCR